MNEPGLRLISWGGSQPPTEAELIRLYAAEDLRPYRWSNGPGDRYAAHQHGYHKVIYVVSGSITFGLPEEGRSLILRSGDRLELPAGVTHDAIVGPDGVICLEAHH